MSFSRGRNAVWKRHSAKPIFSTGTSFHVGLGRLNTKADCLRAITTASAWNTPGVNRSWHFRIPSDYVLAGRRPTERKLPDQLGPSHMLTERTRYTFPRRHSGQR